VTVSPPGVLSGLLVAVITGGRPRIAERGTARFLDSLHTLGVHDVVWVVSDQDAPGYERDGHDLCVYERDWAFEHAREHWMRPERPKRDAFLGAFPGREWACREAERRGCWGVLQLDDNLDMLSFPRLGSGSDLQIVRDRGGLAWFADLLSAVTVSTNGRMVGAQLSAVQSTETRVARPGFPYSLFIEQVGEGREPWYGPFEDDITHAFQYGTRADGTTSLVVPMLRYEKEGASKSGMRGAYDDSRSVQLQRMFPESAKLVRKNTKSNGITKVDRLFHQMLPGAIRSPLSVQDPDLFRAVRDEMADALGVWTGMRHDGVREKLQKRAARHP
jgi:hypothetical protein